MQEKTGYRIASFNIEKFSRQSVYSASDKESRKDLDMIGRIIRENDIDIIAIQEITHQNALKELLEKISLQYAKEEIPTTSKEPDALARFSNLTREVYGYSTKHWEGRWAKPASIYSDRAAEGYAFIWNRDRIKLVTSYENETFEPRIGFNLKKGKLVRSPFIGRFMPIRGRFEFRIINTHIAWETPANVKNEADERFIQDKSDIELRKSELQTLLDTVYASLDKKQYDVNRKDRHARPLVPYTFLLGDYNLNLPGEGEGAKMPESLETYGNGELEIITVNRGLTTLKDNPKDPEEAKKLREDPEREHHLANNYDHFSYDRSKIIRHNIADPEVGVIYAFDNYASAETEEKSKYDLYREKVSDHLPIILDIDIRKKR